MSENTIKLVEMIGFDVREMVNIYSAQVEKIREKLADTEGFDPESDLPELREEVVGLWKFGVEVNKIGRELQEDFDKFIKLMYELEIFDKNELPLVRDPRKREGAGRQKMSKEDRIKAFQKRLAEGD